MTFWDDVNKALGYPKNISGQDPNWDALNQATTQGFSLNGVNPTPIGPLPPPLANPYDRGSNDTNAIIQSGQQGFKIFDIVPGILDANQFQCTITPAVLSNLFEYEPPSSMGGAGQINASWRTVPLTVEGNFLKIDLAPARKDYYNTDGLGSDHTTLNYEPDLSKPGSFSGSSFTQSANEDRSTSRQILIQFESTTAPVLIAEPGKSYELPFTKVFISMRCWATNIRVTTGSNAKISPAFEGIHAIRNMSLAMSPGYGLHDSPIMHFCPFSIDLTGTISPNAAGQNPIVTPGNGANAFAVPSMAAGTFIDQTQLDGFGNPVCTNGVGYLWITNISIVSISTTAADTFVQMAIQKTSPGTPLSTFIRTYAKFYVNCRTSSWSTQSWTPAEPVRISVQPNEQVWLRAIDNGTSSQLSWSINGYTLGKLRSVANAGNLFGSVGTNPNLNTVRGPFYLQTLAEAAFPEDTQTNGPAI